MRNMVALQHPKDTSKNHLCQRLTHKLSKKENPHPPSPRSQRFGKNIHQKLYCLEKKKSPLLAHIGVTLRTQFCMVLETECIQPS